MLQNILAILSHALKAGCIALIKAYQWLLSPVLGQRCRFYPTCSQYAVEAMRAHQPFYALWLIAKRLVKCHPFGGSGYDPVPSKSVEKGEH